MDIYLLIIVNHYYDYWISGYGPSVVTEEGVVRKKMEEFVSDCHHSTW